MNINSDFLKFLLVQDEIAFLDIQNAVISKYQKSNEFDLYIDLFSVSLSNLQENDIINALKILSKDSLSFQICFKNWSSYLLSQKHISIDTKIKHLLTFKEFFKSELTFNHEINDIREFLIILGVDQGMREDKIGNSMNLPFDLIEFLKSNKSSQPIIDKVSLIESLI